METFKEKEKTRNEELIKSGFFSVKGGGYFRGDYYSHILKENENNPGQNLFESIRENAIKYFEENIISWWGGKKPTANTLSSQIACLNHLFPIRDNHDLVLRLVQSISPDFKKVLPLKCDKDEKYIAFEAVSGENYLNEDGLTRGTQCTSVDAIILAEKESSKKVLIGIEWKYTESYGNGESSDKSSEIEENGNNKGEIRMNRYNQLITHSTQLKTKDNYQGSIYYYEPYYQLMRQTLWMEQMIEHKAEEKIKVDDFIHLHIVPKENDSLLIKNGRNGKTMEETWKEQLQDRNKYICISPSEFFEPLKGISELKNLVDYLRKRYWEVGSSQNIAQQ